MPVKQGQHQCPWNRGKLTRSPGPSERTTTRARGQGKYRALRGLGPAGVACSGAAGPTTSPTTPDKHQASKQDIAV